MLVSYAYVRVVEAGKPVTESGLRVAPDDLLHGDEHGVTNVPMEVAAALPEACRRIEAAERILIDYARSGSARYDELVRRYGAVD